MNTIETLAELRAVLDSTDRETWVRYSRGPEDDAASGWLSRNHATGDVEAGLSVDHLDADADDGTLLKSLVEYEYLRARASGIRGYICTADYVGRGSDGEPIVAGVTPLAWVGESLQMSGGLRGMDVIASLRLRARLDAETVRLDSVTDPIMRRIMVKYVDAYREALGALDSGRRWFGDVEDIGGGLIKSHI